MLYFKQVVGIGGCDGCYFEDKLKCPSSNNGVHLLPAEQRICYNKEKDEEVILVPCNKEESIYSIEEEV